MGHDSVTLVRLPAGGAHGTTGGGGGPRADAVGASVPGAPGVILGARTRLANGLGKGREGVTLSGPGFASTSPQLSSDSPLPSRIGGTGFCSTSRHVNREPRPRFLPLLLAASSRKAVGLTVTKSLKPGHCGAEVSPMGK